MARTGAPSARHIVATVHDGTDYGVFKASAEDIRLGDDMSHEQAVKTAKRSAANQKGARWYDFGDTEYNEEGKGGSMARTSPRFAALVRGKLPGALLDTEDMSVSTLRQYERNGWIRRSGAKDPRSWAYVTLTRDGYSAGN